MKSIMGVILGFLALIPFIRGSQFKERKNIIIANLTSRILYISQYIVLGAFAGAAFDLIGLISTFIAKNKEKDIVKKHIGIIVAGISLALLCAGILLYENVFSLLALLGIILEITALWLTEEKNIRIVSLLSAPFWLAYNLASGAYGAVPGNILVMVSIISAMLRLDIKKK